MMNFAISMSIWRPPYETENPTPPFDGYLLQEDGMPILQEDLEPIQLEGI